MTSLAELRKAAEIKITDDGDAVVNVSKRDLKTLLGRPHDACVWGMFAFGIVIGAFVVFILTAIGEHH